MLESHYASTPRSFALAAMLCFAVGCGDAPPPANSESVPAAAASNSPASPVAQGYVGSAACVACHAEQSAAYHGHPMSRSLTDASAAIPVEDYEHAQFESSDSLTYYVERTSTGVLHHEKRVDSEGEAIYDQAVPIAFTVGSGARGRSYLINDDGRLYASPISWYTGPAKWALSPGYAHGHHRRFERRVSEGCIVCHAGRATLHETDPSRFAADPFPEQSIGCERCHGPGEEHVAQRSSGRHSGADPIFNPARVDDARRDAVCNQCHLQGRLRVVRSGQSEFDFRPGMLLSDNWIIFLKTAGIADDEEGRPAAAVSQVEQMYSSRCFLQSKGKLSCITCHTGHRPPEAEEAALHYRTQCLTCHSPGQTECSEKPAIRAAADNDSCIACHMPRAPAADVHAAQTDHGIRRRPAIHPADNAPQPEVPLKDSPIVLFEEPGAKPPQLELDRARGIFLAEQATAGGTVVQARQAVDLLIRAMQALPQDVESRYQVGLALERLEQAQLATQAWDFILTINPRHEDALEALGSLHHKSRDLERARDYYTRLLEVNPGRSRIHGRLAHILGQLRDARGSIEHAERALELNPSLVQSHAWLAEVYDHLGDKAQADAQRAIIKRFESGAAQAAEPQE